MELFDCQTVNSEIVYMLAYTIRFRWFSYKAVNIFTHVNAAFTRLCKGFRFRITEKGNKNEKRERKMNGKIERKKEKKRKKERLRLARFPSHFTSGVILVMKNAMFKV